MAPTIEPGRLHVLHIAPISTSLLGGPLYSVVSLCKALSSAGTKTTLATTATQNSGLLGLDYPIVSCAGLFSTSLDQLLEREGRPDLISFHSTYILKQAILARHSRRLGIPYVIVPRGGMTVGAQRRKAFKKLLANALFFRAMVRSAVAIHCLNESEADEARTWGVPVFVSPNGIDPQTRCNPLDHAASSSIRFLFIGRIDIEHKGLDRLLGAVSLIADDFRATKSTVALYGPHSSKDFQRLRRQISVLGLGDIVATPGEVRGADKTTALIDADCFVHLSRYEGHPIAVLEALTHGLPCLLTRETNVSGCVQAAGAGWEVGGRPEDASRVMQAIMRDPSQLRHMRPKAIALARDQFDWGKIAAHLSTVYQSLVREYRGRIAA